MGINSAIKIKYIKFILACMTSLLISISLYGQNDVTNVIIIISDDLNDSVEGMGGHPQALTPNIDRLIDMGVQFTNAHANAPICVAYLMILLNSRSQILTLIHLQMKY